MIKLTLKNNFIYDDFGVIGELIINKKRVELRGKYNISIFYKFNKIIIFKDNNIGEIKKSFIIYENIKYRFSQIQLISFIRGYSNEVVLYYGDHEISKFVRKDYGIEVIIESEFYLLPSLVFLIYISPYTLPKPLPKPIMINIGGKRRAILILTLFGILILIYFLPLLGIYSILGILILILLYIYIVIIRRRYFNFKTVVIVSELI
jgi:hypothetical protein